MVHRTGNEGSEAARVCNCRIRRGQAGALAEKASEKEPQASGNGSEAAASVAPAEQEIELFDRIFQRLVSGQGIFRTEGCAEIPAQSAEIVGSVERRCARPGSGG